MSRLVITDQRLRLEFSLTEKLLGALRRDLDVPLSNVGSVDLLEDSWSRAVHGLRVGLGLPGVRLLGTWRKRGLRQLVDLRRGLPSLRITLRDHAPYDEVLVSTPDADALLDTWRRVGAGRRG
jgi:hypothetical protein